MYPPKATDAHILSLVKELTRDGRPPSGAALRAELARRYGTRGGVARIYRLLAYERPHERISAPSSIGARLLEVENQNLREQLKQMRQREDAHQAHWSRAIGQLWTRIRTLESQVSEAVDSGEISDSLRKAVAAAEVTAGQLEVLLRAFGPAAGRSRSSD